MLKPDAEGVLPGDFVASFEKDDLRLGLLGLNSTFLQLERGISAEMQMLAVDAEQIQAAADGDLARWAKGHDAFLLLTHQPLSWLREGSVKALERHVINPLTPALHLYGHMHVPDFRRESRGGNPEKRRLQGAALFGLERRGQEDEDRVHGYCACRLEMDDEKACIRVWPRRIVEREGWDFEPDQDYKLMRDHRGRRDEIQPVPVTLYEGRVRRSRRRTHQRPQARPADTPDESSPLAVRERDAAERLRAEISRGGFHGYTSEKSDGLREIIRALSQLYAEDRLGSLPEGERVLTLEDLVESGRRLGLRSDPEWSPFLDYCALDAAVVRVDRGEFRRARAAAREVLDLRGAHSAHGQRALEILCDAAYAAGDRNAAIDWLELWFQVPPERRTNDAFFKQARRYPRWRGNLAVRRLDEDLER